MSFSTEDLFLVFFFGVSSSDESDLRTRKLRFEVDFFELFFFASSPDSKNNYIL